MLNRGSFHRFQHILRCRLIHSLTVSRRFRGQTRMVMTLSEIAELLGAEVEGDGSVSIIGPAGIEHAGEGHLSMIANPGYDKWINQTRASALLLHRSAPPCNKPNIRLDKPEPAFFKIIEHFHPHVAPYPPGIDQTVIRGKEVELGANVSIQAYVVIGDRVRIGDRAVIGPGVVIGDECRIGSDTFLYANVTLRERTILGNNVIIHSGAVIGSDGFGYTQAHGSHHKIPQVGRVVIEDDVEIGANTTIDRATLGETVIKRGTKLDNLVHIAHNAIIGEDVVMAAQVGVSGSTEIGDGVMVAGQVGFVDHISVGAHTKIGAKSGVSKSLPADSVYFGAPARPINIAKRIEAVHSQLPDLLKRVKEQQKRIEELEKRLDLGTVTSSLPEDRAK